MLVELIQVSPAFEQIPQIAAGTCVGADGTKHNLEAAVKSGHLSVLEHISMTFKISKVSRSLTHQLVRHRIASYSQQSQRYCKIDVIDPTWFVIPDSIKNNEEAYKIYEDLMISIGKAYSDLYALGISKEDARYVMPNATHTTIIMTMNGRAFIEQAKLRLCTRAQWEIRELYTLMRNAIKYCYPTVYKLARPGCGQRTGCLEARPCNDPWIKNNKE